jgi:hypothetical protein
MSLLTLSKEDASPVVEPAHTPSAANEVSTHRQIRSSVLATVSLLFAIPGALAVATGILGAAGAALGLVGALFAIGGLTATRQRHIAGRGNAVIGLLLGLGALAAGALSVTGNLPWLDPHVNQLTNLIAWLSVHATWVTPKL